MKRLNLLFGFLLATSAWAQAPSATFHGTGAPSLPCGPAQLYQRDDTSPQTLYFCVAPSNATSTANWSLFSSGGGDGDALLAGTNQSWTGTGGLTVGGGGVLVLPLATAGAMTTPTTPGGNGGGQGVFNLMFNNETYTTGGTSIVDTQQAWGYNIGLHGSSLVSTEPAWFWGLENDYLVPGQDPASNLFTEAYLQFQPTANGATRPIFIQVHRDANCITSGLCDINDFELNSDPALGIGFHQWADNSKQWAYINGNSMGINGYATQTGDTQIVATGQNGKYAELHLQNSVSPFLGFHTYSVSDSSTIWQFDLLATSGWIQYNNARTSLGGAKDYPNSSVLTVEGPSGNANVTLTAKAGSSATGDVLDVLDNSNNKLVSVTPAGISSFKHISLNGDCISTTCTAATSGAFTIAAAGTSATITTTAVGQNSEIFITEDSSLGAKLSVTCSSTATAPQVTSRTSATSFTVTATTTATNPGCYAWHILN